MILSLFLTSFFGEIFDSIDNMKNLKELDLGSCKFTGAISTSMVNLTCLIALDLAYNEFIGIIEFDMFTKLKSLELLSLSKELNLA